MLRRCLKDNCVARPTLVCLCTPNRYFMCNKHLSDHLDNDIGEHKLEDLYIPPNPEIKRSMIERLNLIRSEIARFMSNLIHESSKLIKEIEKQVIISSQNLLECDNRCKKLMFEVSQIVEIEKFGNWSNIQQLLVNKPDDIDVVLKDWNIPNLVFNIQKSLNSVKDCFNTNFLTHLPKIENFYEREPSDNEISIFKCHSKQLIYINLANFDSYRLRLQLPEKINSSAFNCLLPDKSIFSYGNFSYEYSGITFIIEKSQRVVNLPPGASCTGSGGLYLKGFVYTFGGKNHDGMMNRAEKFIFENDLLEWRAIKNLPQPGDFCSCANYEDKILVSGRGHNKLYLYNPQTNKYTSLLNFKNTDQKIICKASDRFYLIISGFMIFESWIDDIHKWQPINNTKLSIDYLLSYRVFWNNGIYFIDHKYKLYKFDFSTKEVVHILDLSNV